MRNKCTLIGVALGLLAAVISTSDSGATNGLPRSGADLYERIQHAAADGDRRAQEGLAAIDNYMAARGRPERPGGTGVGPTWSRDSSRSVTLRVEDASPWHITVHNATRINSANALLAYISARHAALDQLADTDPSREVEVAISPARKLSLAELVEVLRCPCTGVTLAVDVYSPDGWLLQAGHDLGGRDVAASAEQIESEILQEVALTLDIYPGIAASDLTFTVRKLTVKLPAEDALLAVGREEILAVDPFTDIADRYAGRAAVLEVVGGPDLREAHARLVLKHPVDSNPIWPTSPDGDSQ